MKRFRLMLIFVALMVGILFFATRTQASSQVEAGLRDSIAANGSGRYLVYMTEQADLSAAYSMSRDARGHYVYDTLRATAQSSQADLLRYLDNQAQRGAVSEYHSFFIVNAVLVDSNLATFDAIANRSDVVAIYGSKEYAIPDPVVVPAGESPDAIEWGVLKIRANEVWSTLGVTGEGIVVANVDTGVEYTHSALNDKYRGTITGSDDFNFYDPANICGGTVCDNNDHGTHTMGTMVGDDGGSNQIGVAPGATWIAAKGCESNSCSDFALLSSAEWILAPCEFGQDPGHPSCDPDMRPHIVNNSWGGGGGDPWYQASVDAWQASGIMPAFSAGNSGPGASTIGSPGDYCNVTASGATDINDVIASFSSRGPGDFPNCTDKPDVTAPGANVRSSVRGNSYANFNGTSMASPHTAGCMALLLSIDPSLTYDDLYTALTTTGVDLGAGGFDFNYGYGRIDCYEAALTVGSNFTLTVDPESVDVCIPNDAVFDINVGSINGFDDDVTLSALGVPTGYTSGFSVNPVSPPGSSVMTLSGSVAASAGSYAVDVVGVATTRTHTTTVQLNLADGLPSVSLVSPANGAINVPLNPTFEWSGSGSSYTIDIATDSGFTNIVESATVNTTMYTSDGLAGNDTYYWRVTANNGCGSEVSATWSFTTVDLQCSSPNLSIPDNDPTGVTDEFMIGPAGTIDDLDITLDVTHTWVGDVVFELEHVDTGTSVVFYDRPGVPASTFGCSGDDVDATISDEGGNGNLETTCLASTPAIAGTLVGGDPPNSNLLAAFDGEEIAGTWRITASDHAGGDTGTLNTWCIEATTSGGGEPDIDVDPASLSSTQPPDTVTMDTLDVSNIGTADLTWMIDEADPASAVAPAIAPDRGGNPERQGVPTQSDPKLAGGIFGHEGGDVVQDGGFEAGTPNPFWNEFSSNFGTPLCDAVCGTGGGTGPHSGAWWAWFGGIAGVSETGFVDQDVTIPVGAATLEFWLEIPVAETTGFMDVRIDGDLIATYTEADQGAFSSYQLESFDVSAYADGGVHNLEFTSTTDAGAGVLNFFIDDVSLVVEEPQAGCDLPTDVSWLSVNPTAGTTISGTTTTVDVTFDSTGLAVGTYNAILCVNSNDPDTPLVEVPVDLTVEEGEPTPTPTSIPPTDTPMPPTETPPATGVELSTFDGGSSANWLLLLIPLTVLVVLAAYFKQLRREE